MTGELICDVDDCKTDAVYAYVWAWGESGVCCANHRTILEQKSTQLARTISFTPITAGASNRELARDERVQFRATILTLEEELVKMKEQAGKRYHEFAQLQAEHVRLKALYKDAEQQLDRTRDELDRTRDELGAALVKTSELTDELASVRLLVPRTIDATPEDFQRPST